MREFIKFNEVYGGMVLEADNGFTCMKAGNHTVHTDTNGQVFVYCDHGKHMLDAQQNHEGRVIGFYKVEQEPFKNGDRVKLKRLNSDTLTGYTGTVVGISVANLINIYIIEMDAYPLPNWPWKCVTIPESCLERI